MDLISENLAEKVSTERAPQPIQEIIADAFDIRPRRCAQCPHLRRAPPAPSVREQLAVTAPASFQPDPEH